MIKLNVGDSSAPCHPVNLGVLVMLVQAMLAAGCFTVQHCAQVINAGSLYITVKNGAMFGMYSFFRLLFTIG